MADFIYLMETRLTPDQQRAVALVTDVARAHEMNIYLTGGAVRDIISGFIIRDLDFSVQGNALKLQKDFEKAGAVTEATDEDTRTIMLLLPGNVRAEVTSTRSERYDKPGKPVEVTPGTIYDDMRRRDFTVNAMALSLNPGSRGLLTDPFNGVADIETKVLRVLHNYAFYEEPSRLIRATRLACRFHWTLEERTQARYDAAKENNYIENISDRAVGHEIEQLAHEDNPIEVLKALEKEGWLKVLVPHMSVAKVDSAGLNQVFKVKQQMQEVGVNPDASPIVMHFLTRKLADKDISANAEADRQQRVCGALEAPGRRRQGFCQEADGQGPGFAITDMEVPDDEPAGRAAVQRHHAAGFGGRAEDQELFDQVAACPAETAFPGNGGDAHYAGASGVQENIG